MVASKDMTFTWTTSVSQSDAAEFENKLEIVKTNNDRTIKLNNDHFHSNIEVFKAQNNGVVETCAKILGFHKYGLRKTTTTYPNGREVKSKAHKWEYCSILMMSKWQKLPKQEPVHSSDLILAHMPI